MPHPVAEYILVATISQSDNGLRPLAVILVLTLPKLQKTTNFEDDHLHKWKTDALGQQGCRNFERPACESEKLPKTSIAGGTTLLKGIYLVLVVGASDTEIWKPGGEQSM